MKQPKIGSDVVDAGYDSVFRDVVGIVAAARHSAARSVNAVMTAAYWMIGRHIVELKQSGEERAAYGTALIERLALDLKRRFGRGFSRQNLQQMRVFYLTYPPGSFCQTLSGESRDSSAQTICQTPSGKSVDVPPTSSLDRIGRIVTDLRRLALPAPVVRLCSAALDQEPTRPRVLRSRGAAQWLVGSSARPTDRLPVLRANRAVSGQGSHACPRQQGADRGSGPSRGGHQGPVRPRVPGPQQLLASEIERARQALRERSQAADGGPGNGVVLSC